MCILCWLINLYSLVCTSFIHPILFQSAARWSTAAQTIYLSVSIPYGLPKDDLLCQPKLSMSWFMNSLQQLMYCCITQCFHTPVHVDSLLYDNLSYLPMPCTSLFINCHSSIWIYHIYQCYLLNYLLIVTFLYGDLSYLPMSFTKLIIHW